MFCGARVCWYNIKPINVSFMLGGLAEWFMAQVLKTCGRKPSEVRILYPPPVGKCLCWLALCEGSPADFKGKIDSDYFVEE